VATDYDNYAVVVACKAAFDETTKTFGRHLKGGILARPNKSLPSETVAVLKNLLTSYDIEESEIINVDQTNC